MLNASETQEFEREFFAFRSVIRVSRMTRLSTLCAFPFPCQPTVQKLERLASKDENLSAAM